MESFILILLLGISAILIISKIIFDFRLKIKIANIELEKKRLEHITEIEKMRIKKALEIEKNKELLIKKRKLKQQDRIERMILSALKELELEGINSIVKSDKYFTIGSSKLSIINKKIYFSYDSKEEMYKTIYNESNTSKYNVKYSMSNLVDFIEEGFNDKKFLKEMLKNKIKENLAEELMNVLSEEKEKNVKQKTPPPPPPGPPLRSIPLVDSETKKRLEKRLKALNKSKDKL